MRWKLGLGGLGTVLNATQIVGFTYCRLIISQSSRPDYVQIDLE